ncbi:lytic transglycosylase domain-containing protein [Streptomyces shenzhenensis]|uniref:Transglycosylase SLT domain-containing protein n=1 Tax=Streptomyces shenzhenensis TaxID=943815 RepID=A0A3M0I8H7_9ACTN|nr:lytic transglycosylase domain-containing protein [Streptomyces shenzhenensis]RMB84622.1 hypothetical protein CTZ28_18050 [Streptomyces shenzhenensis]
MSADMGEKGGDGDGGESGVAKTVRNTGVAVLGFGCLLLPVVLVGGAVVVIIFGGLGVLLAPLIALILLFGGGGGSHSDADNEATANEVVAIMQGDGKDPLDESTVPEDLVQPIEDAGKECETIGPVVIVSQIEFASGYNSKMVGPDGEKGISQLPPAVFEKYGKDDDDNGKVSAEDDVDSIRAQGRFMCDLADEAQNALDTAKVKGNVLDLTLAAYKVGMDAVLAAKGVPQTNEALGYVAAVRAQFAKYAGVAAPPPGATPGVTPTPTETRKTTTS